MDHKNQPEAGAASKRRYGFAAVIGLLGVAALVAVTATVVVMRQDDTTANQAADNPAGLDPDKWYTWMDFGEGQGETSEITDDTKEYDSAFWEWLETELPQAEYTAEKHAEEEHGDDVADDAGGIRRFEPRLTHDTKTQFDTPAYRLSKVEVPHSTGTSNYFPTFAFDDEPNEQLINVEVYPEDGYTAGTAKSPYTLTNGEGALDIISCADVPKPAGNEMDGEEEDADAQCDESTTSDGERLVSSTVTYSHPQTSDVSNTERSVALYRDDGTAVLAENAPETGGDEPAMDFEELSGLAQAMPDAPVR